MYTKASSSFLRTANTISAFVELLLIWWQYIPYLCSFSWGTAMAVIFMWWSINAMILLFQSCSGNKGMRWKPRTVIRSLSLFCFLLPCEALSSILCYCWGKLLFKTKQNFENSGMFRLYLVLLFLLLLLLW